MVFGYLLLQNVKHFVQRGRLRQQIGIVEQFGTSREFNCQEDRMFDLVPDVGSREVVEESFEIISNFDFILILASVLPLYEVFIDVLHEEWFYERCVFFLLVVPC